MADDSRWTCEACGCHSNTEAADPVSCGVCGTRRAPALLRRLGHPPSARIIHGGGLSSRGFVMPVDDDDDEENVGDQEEDDDDDEAQANDDDDNDDDERNNDGMGMGADGANDDNDELTGALAEAHGAARATGRSARALRGSSSSPLATGGRGGRRASHRRSSQPASSLPNPEELLSLAVANASSYRPRWADPACMGGRGSGSGSSGGIVVDGVDHPSVAHLPEGAGEGRAIRASAPLPRAAPSATTGAPGEGSGRRTFGFKVAFDHPGREPGRSMGGCYLVGVTTASFGSYGERSGLQQSRLFWGVEDGGRRYEGGATAPGPSSGGGSSSARRRHQQNSRGSSSGGPPPPRGGSGGSHGVQLGRSDAPRNADNVLFGSREVLTVLSDADSRTLSYWRDGRFLGNLVSNVPRTANLYPVAVPFNAGVCVAITGLDGDPLAELSNFHSAQLQTRRRKEDARRAELGLQRSLLIQDGRLTPELVSVLKTIFSWYGDCDVDAPKGAGEGHGQLGIGRTAASRLWYRCGLRLGPLRALLEGKAADHGGDRPRVMADDFVNLVASVVREEEATAAVHSGGARSGGAAPLGDGVVVPSSSFEVGDRVEVSVGYERYGDAASGPLRPGDRGTVLEVQRGPRGDRQSVRVVHGGRRWWYQPQALLSERSGLVETPAVRFVHAVLRSHGYDHVTLEPLWGKPVTPDSWRVGDLVVLRRAPTHPNCMKDSSSPVGPPCFPPTGRIVAEAPPSLAAPASSSRGRESGGVSVEYVNPLFGDTAGAPSANSSGSSSAPKHPSLFTRRVKVRNLIHTSFYHGASVGGLGNAPTIEQGSLAPGSDDEASVDEVMAVQSDADDGTVGSGVEDDDSDPGSVGTASLKTIASDKLKTDITNLSKLDAAAIANVSRECVGSPASLAGAFAAGLPGSILAGMDLATERASNLSDGGQRKADGSGENLDSAAVSALCALSVAVVGRLFPNEGSSPLGPAPVPEPATAPPFTAPGRRENAHPREGQHPLAANASVGVPSSPQFGASAVAGRPFRQDGAAAASASSLLLPHYPYPGSGDPQLNPLSGQQQPQQASVRDLIRDLGAAGGGPSSTERRRGVLLALMASARMSDDGGTNQDAASSRGSGAVVGAPMPVDAFPPPFGRPGAGATAAAVFGYGAAHPPPSMYGQPRRAPPAAAPSATATTRNPPPPGPPAGAHPRPPPLLETLLRGHINASVASAPSAPRGGLGNRGTGGPISAPTKSLIQVGLLQNSHDWVEGALGTKGSRAKSSSGAPSGSGPTDAHSARDEDGIPALLLAISFGCSNLILDELIQAGAQVGEREIQEAAASDQARALAVLLRHSVYSEGTVDLSQCSSEVCATLRKATERQKVQEDRMRGEAGRFASMLLSKMVRLGLACRRIRGRDGEELAKAVSAALVGEVLLLALHRSQHRALATMGRSGCRPPPPPSGAPVPGSSTPSAAEDGRVPAFGAAATHIAASSHLGSTAGGGSLPTSTAAVSGSFPPPPSSEVSLLNSLPPHILQSSFTGGDANAAPQPALEDKMRSPLGVRNRLSGNDSHDLSFSSLTDFFRLTESYLWSKDVRDLAVGLTLAETLLRKAPSVCILGEIDRYGINDLATFHAALADEALAEIAINRRSSVHSNKGVLSNGDESGLASADVASAGVVLCPKRHATVLHLTRHSSFRCDLCGRGVERGKSMHGCRECDWDACEACTDRAEGGIVKWCHVRGLALECQRLLAALPGQKHVEVENGSIVHGSPSPRLISNSDDELRHVSQEIRNRNRTALLGLASMLDVPGKVTMHEFSSFILPSLHFALIGDARRRGAGRSYSSAGQRSDQTTSSAVASSRRRSKKPRVGGSGRKKGESLRAKDSGLRSSFKSLGMFCKDEIDREAFLRTAVEAFVLAPRRRADVGRAVDPSAMEDSLTDEDSTTGEHQMAVVHMDDPHDDEEEEEESDEESAEQPHAEEKPAVIVPEVFRRIHSVLAFHETVMIIQHKRRGNSESSGGSPGGELQALTLPFEIEFSLSTYGSTKVAHTREPQAPLEDLRLGPNAGVVHIEPLMPMSELRLHVLRTCQILNPAYLQYCRRLALDRAIIAERPKRTSHKDIKEEQNSNTPLKGNCRKIAQVIAFDEITGAHLVRYASHFLSNHASFGSGEDDLLFSEQSISDQLEFHGREAMLMLAVRDYSILHRDDRVPGADNGTHFEMDTDILLSDGIRQHNVNVGMPSPAMPSFAAANPEAAWALNQYKAKESVHSEGDSVYLLPVGMRVESDVESSGGSWSVYTILSAEYGTPQNAGAANGDSSQATVLNSRLNNRLDACYTLVSDAGEVITGVPSNKVRGHDTALHQRQWHQQRYLEHRRNQLMPRAGSEESDSPEIEAAMLQGGHHTIFERGIPIASVRRATSSGSHSDSGAGRSQPPSTPKVGVLKRTWSALSPLQKMSPLDLSVYETTNDAVINSDERSIGQAARKMSIGGNEVEIDVDLAAVEKPPLLTVEFSLHDHLPTVAFHCVEETTLISALQRLIMRDRSTRRQKLALGQHYRIFYSVSMQEDARKLKGDRSVFPSVEKDIALPSSFSPPWTRPCSSDEPAKLENEQLDSLMQRSIVNSSRSSDPPPNISADQEMDISQGAHSDSYLHKDAWVLPTSGINIGTTKANNCHDNEAGACLALSLCEGLNEFCVQCMEVLCVLGECSAELCCEEEHQTEKIHKRLDDKRKQKPDMDLITPLFESKALTRKLLEQLEDPLTVVGGALPDWCTAAPSFAPLVFSHASRRLLLERAAFGVSRAALRQQEAKVAVGPLRQRMAALRGRAVELVGEAFSGGAADPTALQLQADELYGMEEALAARVSAAFRAQRWDERSLQCAKAAVRRDALLKDAAAVMDHYANDSRVRRRRLEVRFEGESGFDAAAGDEAGVTRGFYADVAEALLSCDHVAGVFCSPICPKETVEPAPVNGHKDTSFGKASVVDQHTKLPLWIPDMDSSRQVIIPTPRADPRSGLGVFPRPLSPHHPQRAAVLEQYRFMGRLFAAALRDGFIFPLPLSASFLRLVQSGLGHTYETSSWLQKTSASSSNSSLQSTDNLSNNSNSSVPSSVSSSPIPNSNMSIEDASNGGTGSAENVASFGDGRNDIFIRGTHSNSSLTGGTSEAPAVRTAAQNPLSSPCYGRHGSQLTSLDLPRPGFLAGDVFAVENHICMALDKLDVGDPVLSQEELERRRQEIASDKSFARKALGKSYDCSFEEFFEDKSFVDPLDPTQGEDAAPLCPSGHLRSVTINNVREWVALAKQFLLSDGVIAQAQAFRRGVEDFFSADALRLFTAEELQRDVCGGGDNVDKWDESAIRSLFKLDGGKGAAEALVAVAAMGGEGGAALSRRFGPSSPTIGYLVKALLEASPNQRRQFLSFVTSVPIVTPGQIEVVPVVNPSGDFLPMSDPGCLPRANTCARRLYLPKFENYQSFAQVIWAVVKEESRFKGFYEWRG